MSSVFQNQPPRAGIPFGIPKDIDRDGRSRILMMVLKAPYLLGFRHKKRRPWTSLDVVLVEPGGGEIR